MRARSLFLGLVLVLPAAIGVDSLTLIGSIQQLEPAEPRDAVAIGGRRPGFAGGFEPVGDESFRALARGYEVRIDVEGATFVPTEVGVVPPEARVTPEDGLQTAPILRIVPLAVGGARALEGERRLPGVTNYLLGADPASWKAAVPRFGAVRLAEAFPGIDWMFRVEDGVIAYDFVVSAGADPASIRLRIEGAGALRLEPDGSLRVGSGAAEFRHSAPEIYQQGAGGRDEAGLRGLEHG